MTGFDAGSIFTKIKLDTTEFKKGVVDVQNQTKSVQHGFIDLGAAISGIAKATAVAGAAIAGLATVAAKAGIDAAKQFEQSEIAYKTLLGSMEEAQSVLKAIQEDAKKTPFNLADLVKANQLLISAGESASESRKFIMNLGDAISATGGGTAELQRLAVNLQQIKAVGKASALDVKQFAFAGINIYSLLADVTGKNVEEIKEMDISYELLQKAFAKASAEGGRFAGAMDAQSYSLQGITSNLQDVISLTLKDVVVKTGLFQIVKDVTGAIISFINANQEGFINGINNAISMGKEFIQGISDLISTVKDFITIGEYDEDVIYRIGQAFGISKETIDSFLIKLEDLAFFVGSVIKPIIEFFTTQLGAIWSTVQERLIPIFEKLIADHLPELQRLFNNLKPVFEFIATVIGVALVGAVEGLILGFQGLVSFVSAFVDPIFETILGTINLIVDVVNVLIQLLKGDFEGAWDSFRQVGEDAIRAVKGAMDTLLAPLIGAKNAINDMVTGLEKAILGTASIKGNMSNLGPNVSPSAVAKVKAGGGFATGVQNFIGGLALVGESGPELVKLPTGSNVYPSQSMVTNNARTNNITLNLNAAIASNMDINMVAKELAFKFRNEVG